MQPRFVIFLCATIADGLACLLAPRLFADGFLAPSEQFDDVPTEAGAKRGTGLPRLQSGQRFGEAGHEAVRRLPAQVAALRGRSGVVRVAPRQVRERGSRLQLLVERIDELLRLLRAALRAGAQQNVLGVNDGD